MGEPSLWQRIKSWIGGIGFDLFLWSINMTPEEYYEEVCANPPQAQEGKG